MKRADHSFGAGLNRTILLVALVSLILPFAPVPIQAATSEVWSSAMVVAHTTSPIQIVSIADGSFPAGIMPDDKRVGSVRLRINEDQHLYHAARFSVSVTLSIDYWTDATTTGNKTVTLLVEYDPTTGKQHQDQNVFQIPDAYKVVATITGITDGANILPSTDVILDAGITIERYYPFNASAVPTIFPVVSTGGSPGTVTLSWASMPGAEQYDLEWTIVGAEGMNGGILQTWQISYDFRNNATRITTSATSYTLNDVFEKAWVVFRVRGVGFKAANVAQRIEGAWSLSVNADLVGGAPISTTPWHAFQTGWHQQRMNWKYMASYSEDAKRKEVVEYYDGTMRKRQAVTVLSTANKAVVAESVPDNAGRMAVEILPSPTTDSRFHFYQGFNLSALTNSPYDRTDFDLGPNECAHPAEKLKTTSGAGKYYSSANTPATGMNAYIPDGNGYPFVQTSFTFDNTGRIRSRGGAGDHHQLYSGHETRYFYGTPFQEDLDQLFGADVGFNVHYKKNMSVDPNGQVSFAYLDPVGHTIATSLAGDAPTGIEPLSSNTGGANRTVNLMGTNKIVGEESIALNTHLGSSMNVTHDFSYAINPIQFTDNCVPHDCYDCSYDLTLSVTDECGNEKAIIGSATIPAPIYDTTGYKLDTLCTSAPATPHLFHSLLDIGSYAIAKTIRLNDSAIDVYLNHYIADNTCLKTYNDFLNQALAATDFSGCGGDYCAADCADVTTTSSANGGSTQTTAECITACEAGDPCEVGYDLMLMDMRPGGQYGTIETNAAPTFPTGYFAFHPVPPLTPTVHGDYLSVFNEFNNIEGISAVPTTIPPYPSQLGLHSWRHPFIPYHDDNGNQSFVTIGLNTNELPEHLSYDEFMAQWQDSWAESLVQYHPEYCFYQWCANNKPSNDYDAKILNTAKYADAVAAGLLPDLLTGDPFFTSRPGDKQKMLDQLSNFGGPTSTLTMKEMAVLQVNCNTCVTMTSAFIASCLAAHTFGANPATQDDEWEAYRDLYMGVKNQIVEGRRYAELRDIPCQPWINCIGRAPAWPSPEPNEFHFWTNDAYQWQDLATMWTYWTKKRRYPTATELIAFTSSTDPTVVLAAAKDSLNKSCADQAEGYADVWMAKISSCRKSYSAWAADSVAIRKELIEICELGCDECNPFGSSTTPTGKANSSGHHSFDEVLRAKFGSTYPTNDCDANLIGMPLPYGHDYEGPTADPAGCACETEGKRKKAECVTCDSVFLAYKAFIDHNPLPVPESGRYFERMSVALNARFSFNYTWMDYVDFMRSCDSSAFAAAQPDTISSHPIANSNVTYRASNTRITASQARTRTLPGQTAAPVQSALKCDTLSQAALDIQALLTTVASSKGGLTSTGVDISRTDDLSRVFMNSAFAQAVRSTEDSCGHPLYSTCTDARHPFVCNANLLHITIGNTGGPKDTTCHCDIDLKLPNNSQPFASIVSLTGMQPDLSNVDAAGECHGFFLTVHFSNGSTTLVTGRTSCAAITHCVRKDPCADAVINDTLPLLVTDVGGSTTGTPVINVGGTTSSSPVTATNAQMEKGTKRTVTAPTNSRTLNGNAAMRQGVPKPAGKPRPTWSRTTSVQPGKQYLFSVTVKAANAPTISPISIEANGEALDVQVIPLARSSGQSLVEATWQAGSANTASFKVQMFAEPGVTVTNITLLPLHCDSELCNTNPFLFATPPDPCHEMLENIAIANATNNYAQYLDSIKKDFRRRYVSKCMALKGQEAFTMKYHSNEYHYTLYYYDQANNLVQTTPPQGVVPITSATELQHIYNCRIDQTVSPQPAPLVSAPLSTRYWYNSLNQLIRQTTPDAGESRYHYDRLGRLVVSQNARQAVVIGGNKRYSYTIFDDLGRIVEVGQVAKPAAQIMTQLISRKDVALKNWINAGTKSEVTQTHYDKPLNSTVDGWFLTGQQNLRGRVASTMYFDDLSQHYLSASHYGFDVHGNVNTLIQENHDLAAIGHDRKRIDYHYDLISGKVNAVDYQAGAPDQFHHHYAYDADNRIVVDSTSPDSVIWDRDAKYFYYDHGPLGRVEIGDAKVQGMDYAYSIQGWIKGVNSNTLTPDNDMGHDGTPANPARQWVGRDEFAYTLGYFPGDYVPIGTSSFEATTISSGLEASGPALYNGNISHMVTSIGSFMQAGAAPLGTAYGYDQLNRLHQMSAFNNLNMTANKWNGVGALADYETRLTYDANGNIMEHGRNGTSSPGPLAMDQLAYFYIPGTNKLDHVTDAIPDGNYPNDIDNQQVGNYRYDPSGNLIQDHFEKLNLIEWNVAGKIKAIRKPGLNIEFRYDPAGNRIEKIVGDSIRYYFRDALGNVMATYMQKGPSFRLDDNALYGGNRLGEYQAWKDMIAPTPANPAARIRGKREFELTNYLGNVQSVVTDRMIPHPSGTAEDWRTADVLSATDYYAFGTAIPGRTYISSTSYYHGFNRKEKDDEVKGRGDCYDFGARIYDPRLAVFLSIDPRTRELPWQSPYIFADDKPIRYVDIDGMGAGDRVKAAEGFVGKVTYSQAEDLNTGAPLRTGFSDKALKYTDCSELVCRVLYADGITKTVELHLAKKADLGILLDDKTKFEHSDKPQVGDIALWDGHTGIVGGVDKDGNIQLIHAAGKGKGALKNKYAIKPDVYRPGATFYGYYRPKTETADGKKSAEEVMKVKEQDPVESAPAVSKTPTKKK
jgi:RHS repeat-associated protein